MGEKGRRDHFVPQTYLRAFCNAEGVLWAYIVQRSLWIPTTPIAVGCEKGFYDFSPEVAFHKSVDPLFNAIESDFSKVGIANLTPVKDWREHRRTLVRFAAMQSARTPRFAQDAAIGLRAQREDFDDAFERDHVRALMTVEARARDDWFQRLPWAIGYHSDESDPLVTCDVPVGIIGFADADVIFMPLSPSLCLLGGPTMPEGAWLPLPKLGVRNIRGYCAKVAEVFIASPKPWNEGAGGEPVSLRA
jgi:Protein of unknown function (DUF4238)